MLQQLCGRYAAITPDYAAIAVPKYAAIVQQIIVGLT